MTVMSERKAILLALGVIKGLKKVSASWPKDLNTIPCITVDLAGEKTTDHRDDKPYLREMEFYVRLFASSDDVFERVGENIEKIMGELGYEQTFLWEEPGADARQLAARYKKYY